MLLIFDAMQLVGVFGMKFSENYENLMELAKKNEEIVKKDLINVLRIRTFDFLKKMIKC